MENQVEKKMVYNVQTGVFCGGGGLSKDFLFIS